MATILLSICVIALCIILLGVKVLFVKNGKFPSGHIHDNPAMRKHNIECARHEEMKNLNLKIASAKNNIVKEKQIGVT